jgi:hypothetical protein
MLCAYVVRSLKKVTVNIRDVLQKTPYLHIAGMIFLRQRVSIFSL